VFTELERGLLEWLLLSERSNVQARLAENEDDWPVFVRASHTHRLLVIENALTKVRADRKSLRRLV